MQVYGTGHLLPCSFMIFPTLQVCKQSAGADLSTEYHLSLLKVLCNMLYETCSVTCMPSHTHAYKQAHMLVVSSGHILFPGSGSTCCAR